MIRAVWNRRQRTEEPFSIETNLRASTKARPVYLRISANSPPDAFKHPDPLRIIEEMHRENRQPDEC